MATESNVDDSAPPDEDECIQESPKRKAAWLADMEVKFPDGIRVVVLPGHGDSGEPEEKRQVGLSGTVSGYDLGVNGNWPLIHVTLSDGTTDGFYDDCLEIVDTMAASAEETL